MPLYTFSCRTCKKEEEFVREIGDFKEPLCPICSHNPEITNEDERMKKIIPKNARSTFIKTDDDGGKIHETDLINRNKAYRTMTEKDAMDVYRGMWKRETGLNPDKEVDGGEHGEK
tara:strand:+ start:134 stop:481 length:348 start_codon:yes stop_codon:yes gene_type:complete